MKLKYSEIQIREIKLTSGMPALLAGAGSVTTTSVEVGNVSVEPYDAGFQSLDPASGTVQDFGTVSFD